MPPNANTDRRRLCAVALAMLGSLVASAGGRIDWATTERSIAAKPTDTRAVAVYKFRNAGDKPVTFDYVRTSCGCALASLGKRTYQPGEAGQIAVTFTFGHRVGEHTKLIWATTDADRPRGTMLVMKAVIPALLRITPLRTYWVGGEPPTEKLIDIKVAYGRPIRVVKVTSSDERVKTSLKEVGPGRHYQVVVKVRETRTPVRATLAITTDFPPREPRTFLAYARVLPNTIAKTSPSPTGAYRSKTPPAPDH